MSEPVIIGGATLYNCDYRKIEIAGTVITDPPYGIGFKYSKHKDQPEEYAGLIGPLAGKSVALLQYPEEMMRLVVPVLGAPDECDIWIYNSNLPRQSRIWGFWNCDVDFSRVKQKAKNPECAKVKSLMVNAYDWVDDIQQVKGNGSEKTLHPCQLPVALFERIIKLVDPDVVFDPFMGSGSSAIAAINCDKPYVGCELDPDYFAAACKRIRMATAQERLFA
jgi:hypothetical protein